MFGPIAPPSALTPHHQGLLAIRFRSSVDELLGAGDPAASEAPGIARLLELHAADRLRGTTALHPEVDHRIAAERRRALRDHLVIAAAHRGGTRAHARAFLVDVGPRSSVFDDLSERLGADRHVESVGPVPIRYLMAGRASAADGGLVAPVTRNWHLARIAWEPDQRRGYRDAASIRVGVLDSGVDRDHPALRRTVRGYVHRYPGLAKVSARDHLGHGTHVSGIIGGRDPGVDLHGVCRAQIRVWKIFGDQPQLDPSLNLFYYLVEPTLYWRALHACVVEKIDVLNLSLGGTTMDRQIEKPLFDDLLARGTAIVAATGNMRQSGSPRCFPAALPKVIAVGATDENDVVAPFSSRARHMALTAPGVGIWSSLPRYPGNPMFAAVTTAGKTPHRGAPKPRNRHFDAWPGTSMAAPLVAGAVALLLANRGPMSSEEARTALMKAADRVPSMKGKRWTPDYGAGRLNIQRLLAE